MRIVLLCGCLEKGKDGVGDYSRRLAQCLHSSGVRTLLISFSDKFVHSTTYATDSSHENIELVRIPSHLSGKEKTRICRKEITSFNPDWISLQFVIFSFHPKGLPFGFHRVLKNVAAGRKLHIMFHELWVGVNGVTGFKNNLIKIVQRFLIKKIISESSPHLLTTSIPIYKESLKAWDVHILPLFGNIPVNPAEDKTDLGTDTFRIVHFGSFTSDLEGFKKQIQYAVLYAKKLNRLLKFEIIGKGGPNKPKAIEIAKKFVPEDDIEDHGLLPESEVSRIISRCDWGISRADGVMYGKSGSTLSFLEHGLPVLLRGKREVHQYQDLKSGLSDRLIFVGDDLALISEKGMAEERVQKVARLFHNLLETSC